MVGELTDVKIANYKTDIFKIKVNNNNKVIKNV